MWWVRILLIRMTWLGQRVPLRIRLRWQVLRRRDTGGFWQRRRRRTTLLLLVDRGAWDNLPRPSLAITFRVHEQMGIAVEVVTNAGSPALGFALEAEVRILQFERPVYLL